MFGAQLSDNREIKAMNQYKNDACKLDVKFINLSNLSISYYKYLNDYLQLSS